LHDELEGSGLTVVTVALDVKPENAYPFIDAAAPAHPSLVDSKHVTDELFGFMNVPMAVWIDETGVLVRPAEHAAVQRSPLRDVEIPDGLPERMDRMLREVKAIKDPSADYRAAIVDWVEHGAQSQFALRPDEVIERSRPVSTDAARATACFELGQHLWCTEGNEAAIAWWREAHRLDPDNWTYKRQAWTFVTTPDGATEPDLVQGPNETYEGNWLDDVLACGGGVNYYHEPQLD
jgi:hypothetical protein